MAKSGLPDPERAQFDSLAPVWELTANRERVLGSRPPKAARRFAHSDVGHDEFSKTGLCLTMPRSRALSNASIESNTSM